MRMWHSKWQRTLNQASQHKIFHQSFSLTRFRTMVCVAWFWFCADNGCVISFQISLSKMFLSRELLSRIVRPSSPPSMICFKNHPGNPFCRIPLHHLRPLLPMFPQILCLHMQWERMKNIFMSQSMTTIFTKLAFILTDFCCCSWFSGSI